MSKYTITFFLSLSAFTLFGQHKYIPFPDSGAIWVIEQDGKKSFNYYSGGDTIIHDTIYQLILQSTTIPNQPTGSAFAIRQDTINKKVYIFDFHGFNKEFLLYDFDLGLGDTLNATFRYFEGLVVYDIDSVLYRSKYHRVFYVDYATGWTGYFYPFIEGIGSVVGPFQPPFDFEHTSWLICYTTDGDPYYPNDTDPCIPWTGLQDINLPDFQMQAYPNPFNDRITLEIYPLSEDIKGSIEICNFQNQVLIQQNVQPGFSKIEITDFNYPPGLYFAKLQYGDGESQVIKIIHQ